MTLAYQKKLLGVFFTTAVVYLGLVNFISYPLTTLLKPIPIFCLLALVSRAKFDENIKKYLLSALSFSVLGDIALTLPIRHQLELGLGFFLIAHCFYIAIFFRGLVFKPRKIALSLSVILYVIYMCSLLVPLLGDLLIPVCLYMSVITVMVCSAILSSHFAMPALIGAVIFMASDSMIALNEFILPEYNFTLGIMVTYYIAQLLLVVGIIDAKNNHCR